jgi:hypothetical protein
MYCCNDAVIGYIDFISKNGVFNYQYNNQLAFIYSNTDGVVVILRSVSLETTANKNSDTRFISVVNGAKIILDNVKFKDLKLAGCIGLIKTTVPGRGLDSYLDLLNVNMANIICDGSVGPGVIALNCSVVNVNNCNFTNVGFSGKPLFHGYDFFLFLFIYYILIRSYRNNGEPSFDLYIRNSSFADGEQDGWGGFLDICPRLLLIESCTFLKGKSTTRGFIFLFYLM